MSHSYPSGISREQFARILPTLESARHQVPDTRVDRHATDHQPPCHPPMPRRPPFQAQSSSPANQCQISLGGHACSSLSIPGSRHRFRLVLVARGWPARAAAPAPLRPES